MKIRIVHHADDFQQVITEEGLSMIEFEDQRHLGNGMWLHCLRNDGNDISISFDPKDDWFDIFNDK